MTGTRSHYRGETVFYPEGLFVEVVAESSVRSTLVDDHLRHVLVIVVQRRNDLVQSAHHHHAAYTVPYVHETSEPCTRSRCRAHDHHAVRLEHRAAPQFRRRVQLAKLLERPLHFRVRFKHPDTRTTQYSASAFYRAAAR